MEQSAAVASTPQQKPNKQRWLIAGGLFAFLIIGAMAPKLGLAVTGGLLGWSIHALRKKTRSPLGVLYPDSQRQGALAIGSVALGVSSFLFMAAAHGVHHQRQIQAEAGARALANEKVHQQKQRELDELRQQAEQATPTWSAALDSIESLLNAAKPRDALGMLTRAEADMEPYAALSPLPQGLADLEPRHALLKNRAQTIVGQLDTIAGIEPGIREAEGLAREENWVAAEEKISAVLDALSSTTITEEMRPHLPQGFSPDKLRAQAEKLRKKIEPKAEKQKDELRKMAAYVAICGEKPLCGGWDGECAGLESTLKENAHDPDSIDVEACTPPIMTEKSCWVTKCNVRGKNAFGALVLQKRTFSMSKLGVQDL